MAPWFRRKSFGYGWTPASWEGWLATALFVLATFGIHQLAHLSKPNQVICTLGLLAGFFVVILATSARDSDDA
jgi:hypothetical protein